MAEYNNILQELKELNSSLSGTGRVEMYTVPKGYFDGLAAHMLRRVKALDAVDARDEIRHLSTLLAGLPKELPFKVPEGYFEELQENIPLITGSEESETAASELASISPLLSGLKKEMPYSVPLGYFEEVAKPVRENSPARVVPITRNRIFRYAAAAMITVMLAVSAFLIFGNNRSIDPNVRSYAWVEKSLNKVSTDDIDEFAELTEYGTLAMTDTRTEAKVANEIVELVKDIPDSELQEFIEETEVLVQEVNTDEIILN